MKKVVIKLLSVILAVITLTSFGVLFAPTKAVEVPSNYPTHYWENVYNNTYNICKEGHAKVKVDKTSNNKKGKVTLWADNNTYVFTYEMKEGNWKKVKNTTKKSGNTTTWKEEQEVYVHMNLTKAKKSDKKTTVAAPVYMYKFTRTVTSVSGKITYSKAKAKYPTVKHTEGTTDARLGKSNIRFWLDQKSDGTLYLGIIAYDYFGCKCTERIDERVYELKKTTTKLVETYVTCSNTSKKHKFCSQGMQMERGTYTTPTTASKTTHFWDSAKTKSYSGCPCGMVKVTYDSNSTSQSGKITIKENNKNTVYTYKQKSTDYKLVSGSQKNSNKKITWQEKKNVYLYVYADGKQVDKIKLKEITRTVTMKITTRKTTCGAGTTKYLKTDVKIGVDKNDSKKTTLSFTQSTSGRLVLGISTPSRYGKCKCYEFITKREYRLTKDKSSLLICEACEFAGSFLHLKRDLGILLNIDNDHLECYGDMPRLCDAFTAFCTPCKQILVNGHNQNAMTATQNHPHRFCYGFENTMDFYADNLQNHNGFYSFDFHKKGTAPLPITLSIPGKHNIENALAAAGAACLLGASDEAIQKGLEEFFGVERRFQILSRTNGITVADDYAHHPAEIETLLKSAQQMGFSKITAVFQPFTYSRTKALAKEFATALSHAHRVILAPVMGGREEKDPTVSSLLIAKHLREVTLCNSLEECALSALEKATKGELILTMGCGNVYRCAEKIRQLQMKNL